MRGKTNRIYIGIAILAFLAASVFLISDSWALDGTVLPPPTLLSPSNGSFTTDNTPTFDWEDVQVSAPPVKYTLVVDTDSTFNSPDIKLDGLPDSTFTPLTPLADGTYFWMVRARDSASPRNHVSPFSTTFSFTIDRTPPLITPPEDKTVECNTVGGATGIDIGTATATDNVDPSPTVTNDAPSFFPLGDTTVTWTATDDTGNSASATQIITVVDTTPPTIIVPPDIMVTANTAGGATGIDIGTAIATDICDSSPTITNDAPTVFPFGTTTVTWTATDDTGNSASATQIVTVTSLSVSIDIKPGSFPNSINPKDKGVIPVAILTTNTFDAATVKALSIKFGPGMATESHGKGHLEDVDGDGDMDMVLHFNTQQTGIACGQTSATLTGLTLDDMPIEGSDSIRTVPCK